MQKAVKLWPLSDHLHIPWHVSVGHSRPQPSPSLSLSDIIQFRSKPFVVICWQILDVYSICGPGLGCDQFGVTNFKSGQDKANYSSRKGSDHTCDKIRDGGESKCQRLVILSRVSPVLNDAGDKIQKTAKWNGFFNGPIYTFLTRLARQRVSVL